MVDRRAHRDRAAEREARDVGALQTNRVQQSHQVVAQLPQSSIGGADGCLAVSAQVVHEDAMPEHEVGHRSAPGAVVEA